MTDSPTALDYLCAKTWLQKTGRWQDQYQANTDPVTVYLAAVEMYYKADEADRLLWTRIHEVNKNG